MKVLNISHGHPEFSKGGAEVASYNIHKALRVRDDVETLYLARTGSPQVRKVGTPFLGSPWTEDEMFYHSDSFNYFDLSHGEPHEVTHYFRELLELVQPSIVHFHHYFKLGIDLIKAVKDYYPDTAIVVTLYEFIPICLNNGQMVKTYDDALCRQSSPRDCSECFPEKSPSDFHAREMFIKNHLELVDCFVASSHFIKERYIEWGLDEDTIVVIDNGFPHVDALSPRQLTDSSTRNRFGYFGQINKWKGLLVLLEAFRLIRESGGPDVSLDIYGSNLDIQPKEFQREFCELVKELPNVQMHGPYDNARLRSLMEDIDWVVVPSVWWENSPLVIQEAQINGRPVICSDIGGMAEKIRDGHNGLRFSVGDPRSLRQAICRATEDERLYHDLVENLERGPWIDDVTEELVTLYHQLLSQRQK